VHFNISTLVICTSVMYVIKYGDNKMDKIDFLLIGFGASCFMSGWILQLFTNNYGRTNKVKSIILMIGVSLYILALWAGFQL